MQNKFGSYQKITYLCITLNVSLFPKGIFMSLTKRQFEDEINSSYAPDYSDWQSYEEYLYQQYGYECSIDDMYAYFNAQEFVAARKEENPTDSRPLVLSPLTNDLGGNQ